MTTTQEAVQRLRAWIRDFGHEKQPWFIFDLETALDALAVPDAAAVKEIAAELASRLAMNREIAEQAVRRADGMDLPSRIGSVAAAIDNYLHATLNQFAARLAAIAGPTDDATKTDHEWIEAVGLADVDFAEAMEKAMSDGDEANPPKCMATRGAVRRLASCLGITLKESPTL